MNTLTIDSKAIAGIRVKETVLLLTAAVVLQFLVHLIPPYNNTPFGAILLPMFFAPFLALALYGMRTAMIVGILTPVLNYTLLGNPRPELVTLLTLEIAIFVLAASMFNRYNAVNKLSAPLSYLTAKIIAVISMSVIPFFTAPAQGYFLQSIVNAIPGLLILTLLSITVLKMQNKK